MAADATAYRRNGTEAQIDGNKIESFGLIIQSKLINWVN